MKKRFHHLNILSRSATFVVPYVQGISESFKSICGKHGVTVHFKAGKILKNILVSPTDKDTLTRKNSVIYWYRCV